MWTLSQSRPACNVFVTLASGLHPSPPVPPCCDSICRVVWLTQCFSDVHNQSKRRLARTRSVASRVSVSLEPNPWKPTPPVMQLSASFIRPTVPDRSRFLVCNRLSYKVSFLDDIISVILPAEALKTPGGGGQSGARGLTSSLCFRHCSEQHPRVTVSVFLSRGQGSGCGRYSGPFRPAWISDPKPKPWSQC